jgi:hypothetical protein
MKKDLYCCESCDKQTTNKWEDGWIHIKCGLGDTSVELMVTAGLDGGYKPANYGVTTRERFDYCSTNCLLTHMQRLYEERNEVA